MSGYALVFRYTAFALLAILANLGVQRIIFAFDWPFAYIWALLLGTFVGLIIKYILDKCWIFYDRAWGPAQQGKQFTLYSLMGVATTLIFWVTETMFWLAWHNQLAREVGAVMGLTIGYCVKYHLDRRYVFGARAEGVS